MQASGHEQVRRSNCKISYYYSYYYNSDTIIYIGTVKNNTNMRFLTVKFLNFLLFLIVNYPL
jgi:hypothetical protein